MIPRYPPIIERNFKKTDVVAKYHDYKNTWDKFRLCSGADDSAQIRVEVQEKIAYQPPPPPPRAPVKARKRLLPPNPARKVQPPPPPRAPVRKCPPRKRGSQA